MEQKIVLGLRSEKYFEVLRVHIEVLDKDQSSSSSSKQRGIMLC
jgi:hypothetical protein